MLPVALAFKPLCEILGDAVKSVFFGCCIVNPKQFLPPSTAFFEIFVFVSSWESQPAKNSFCCKIVACPPYPSPVT